MTGMLAGCGGSSTSADDGGDDNGGSDDNNGTVTYTVDVSSTEGGSTEPSGSNDYEDGKELEIVPTSKDKYTFTGWTGDMESADSPLNITVDKDYKITANFEKKTYDLTINTEGRGEVGEQLMKRAKKYDSGAVVELTAKPNEDEGWEFKKWKGDLSGSDITKQITVDAPKEVTAVFQKKEFTLQLQTDGQGSVTKSPDQNTYDYGTTVTVTASPDNSWEFKQWQGDLSGSQLSKDVTMDANKTVKAVFEEKTNLFYLADNDVTIKCPAAEIGDTGTVDGITYTKRTARQITFLNDKSDVVTTCTSDIEDMSTMFYTFESFNEDISHWDVGSVTNMRQMFDGASAFNSDLNHWDVSQVTNMSKMFYRADSFNTNINSWDVSQVTNMGNMFYSARDFNQDLDNWDVSSVTNFLECFMLPTLLMETLALGMYRA